jgi:hypothetical protein
MEWQLTLTVTTVAREAEQVDRRTMIPVDIQDQQPLRISRALFSGMLREAMQAEDRTFIQTNPALVAQTQMETTAGMAL